MKKQRLAVIIPDCHIPYHHKRAFKLMQKIMLDLKKQIDEIVILGDFADFYWVSNHPKDPRVTASLLDEIEQVNQHLDWFDEYFPRVRKVYLEGNHEVRLENYLLHSAPALFGVTELKMLLRLNARPNWIFVPYGPTQAHPVLGGNLLARHTPLASTPKLVAQKGQTSLVYGHIHRNESAHAVGLSGQTLHAFSPGWLGDQRFSEVFGYVRDHYQWQLGFALVYNGPRPGNQTFSQIIHIANDISCIVGGKFYKG